MLVSDIDNPFYLRHHPRHPAAAEGRRLHATARRHRGVGRARGRPDRAAAPPVRRCRSSPPRDCPTGAVPTLAEQSRSSTINRQSTRAERLHRHRRGHGAGARPPRLARPPRHRLRLAGPSDPGRTRARWRALERRRAGTASPSAQSARSLPGNAGTRRADAVLTSRATACDRLTTTCSRSACSTGFRERGVRVPGDLSIVGCDDIFGADFCNPPLTTLTAPIEQAGRVGRVDAARRLESRRAAAEGVAACPPTSPCATRTGGRRMTYLAPIQTVVPADPADARPSRGGSTRRSRPRPSSRRTATWMPALLADDAPFPDPAALLITPDHYVTRMLHALGVSLGELGLARNGTPPTAPAGDLAPPLRALGRFSPRPPCATGSRSELSEVFGLTEPRRRDRGRSLRPLAARFPPVFRPRALFDRFGIPVLATTDDPADDLAAHRALRDDPTFTGHVIPDAGAAPTAIWSSVPTRLGASTNSRRRTVSTAASYVGFSTALRTRRRVLHRRRGDLHRFGRAGCGQRAPHGRKPTHPRRGATGRTDGTAYQRRGRHRLSPQPHLPLRRNLDRLDGIAMEAASRRHSQSSLPTFEKDSARTPATTCRMSRLHPPAAAASARLRHDPELYLVLFTVDESAIR